MLCGASLALGGRRLGWGTSLREERGAWKETLLGVLHHCHGPPLDCSSMEACRVALGLSVVFDPEWKQGRMAQISGSSS